VLSDDELRAVLGACAPAVRLYFEKLARTGTRRGEGMGLRPQDVGDGEIRFRVQYGPGGLGPLKT
jgi:hypothetical protein